MTRLLGGLLPLVLLFFALPASAQPTLADWYWQNPLPQGNDLRSVWGRSANDIFAIGGDQTLLHWDGVEWSVDYRPSSYPIEDLWGLDNGVLFASGYGGTVLRYDGLEWTEIPTDFDDWLISIIAFSETDIYVAGGFPGNHIRHFNGVEWSLIGTAPDGIHQLGGSGPDDIYAVGFQGMMVHYDGVEWTTIPGFGDIIDITSVWSNAADDVFALQQGSDLFHFDGTDWTLIGSDSTAAFGSDMWGTSATNVWFVDHRGGLSNYDGNDIKEFDLPNEGLLAVWGDDQGNVHAVGEYGILLGFDGGEWAVRSTAVANDLLLAVWGTSPNDVYAVGGQEIAVHYDGNEWTQIHPTMVSTWFNDVWATAPDDVYAVGKRGIRVFDGLDWVGVDDGLRHLFLPYNGILGFGPDDIVVVGDWGAILRYDGVDWNIVRYPNPQLNELLAVWGAAPDDIWAVGPENEFLHWDGQIWDVVPVATSGRQKQILGFAGDDIYVLGEGGELLHYDGQTWTENTDLAGYNVVAIAGTGPVDMHALSGYGYVWDFDGQDWTYIDTGARTGLTDIWGSASDGIFVVGQGGAILYGGQPSSPVPELAAGERLHLRGEPNPFNPATTLSFKMPRSGRATLTVHDVAGRIVTTLIDRDVPAGLNSVRWDGRDQTGRRQASGVYFASVRTEFGREVQKVTLVK